MPNDQGGRPITAAELVDKLEALLHAAEYTLKVARQGVGAEGVAKEQVALMLQDSFGALKEAHRQAFATFAVLYPEIANNLDF